MNSVSKKVLFINLDKRTSEVKTFPDLHKYIGGVGLGLKLYELYQNEDPLIFSIGPLNGFFPFASKTSVVFETDGLIEDVYFGGYLSSRLRFSDLDSLIIFGRAAQPIILDMQNESVSFKEGDSPHDSLGLPGKRSFLGLVKKQPLLDGYFQCPESGLGQKFEKKRLAGLSVTGTAVYTPKDMEKYATVYKQLLARTKEVGTEHGFFPSCSGCPMGCAKSNLGEVGGNVLSHSLVACGFAENIYTDVGTVFSCLNILGYDYTHEDIENLPILVQNVLKNLG